MEEHFDEEFSEIMRNIDKPNEDEDLNFQIRDFLSITEKDYEEEREEYAIQWIAVSSVENLNQVIDKAEQEKWETLDIEVGFQEIPSEIGKLINLKYLHISREESYGESIVLPSEIGNLKQLEVFEAYGCNIIDLPEEFSQLTNLKIINLNNNKFTVFPKELLSLEKLESLAINCNFEVLPDEICNLIHLKYLFLPEANISYLPDNIGNLQELEVLCIWGTKINHLPNSCQKLKKIKSLYLTKSIFDKILPPEIISQSPLEVINYIVRYQNDTEKIEINESKMIIVGQGGVGKTCLLNRLKNDEYDETISTEGIAIEPWEFEVGGKKYKLNTWDFGGQEIYHATHQFFLTN